MRYGGAPGCTCDPEPRASDGSENGLCAACEDEAERGQEFAGMHLVASPSVPPGQVHIVDPVTGKRLATIVNVGAAQQ